MNPSKTIDLEFAPTGRPLSLAMKAITQLETQLTADRYRLEALVRVNGRLVDALGEEADSATSYAWRVHLAPMNTSEWQQIHHTILCPLDSSGVSVRTAIAQAA